MKLVPSAVPKVREHELQKAIVDALRARGHLVYETTAYRQKGASGVDKGIPDLLVLPRNWKGDPKLTGYLRGIEVKVPGKIKWSSPEQELAWLDGAFVVVQSPVAAVDWIENSASLIFFGDDIHSAIETHGPDLKKRRGEVLVKIEVERQRRRDNRNSLRRAG